MIRDKQIKLGSDYLFFDSKIHSQAILQCTISVPINKHICLVNIVVGKLFVLLCPNAKASSFILHFIFRNWIEFSGECISVNFLFVI